MRRERLHLFGAALELWLPEADHLYWAERSFGEGTLMQLFATRPLPAPCKALFVGAGAGSAALALAVTFPDLRLTCIEHHPDLYPLLARNAAEMGLGERVACLRGIFAHNTQGDRLVLIRSRDAPDYRALVPAGSIEGWMEPLDCLEIVLEAAGGHFDLVISATPELLPAVARHALAQPPRALVARAPSGTGLAARRALEAVCGAALIECGEAGLAMPALGRRRGPLLDIVVPVWGVEAHVVECVRSLLDPPDPEIRVVAVDDGSPDRSAALLREAFGADGPNFVLVPKPNGGAASARNFGRRLGTSPYVGFADADDLAEPGLFPALLEAAELTGLDIVQAGFKFLREAGAEESYEAEQFRDRPRGAEGGSPSFRLAAAELIPGQPSIWRRIYRRDFLDGHAIDFPEHVRGFDDQLFQLRSLAHAGELLMIDGPSYLYRQHAGQTIRQTDAIHFASLEMFRTMLAEHLREGWEDAGPLVTAMVHTMNWSGRMLGEALRPAFVRGAAELLVFSEKALGPALFPAALLAELTDAEIRAEYEAMRIRFAPRVADEAWAHLGAMSFEPALVRLMGPKGFL
ncbi:MAG TPA: glycosyltransferase [Paracoccaceae bacterium]|nr:glycosyltransferase [Paracoccaceae bacterium]